MRRGEEEKGEEVCKRLQAATSPRDFLFFFPRSREERDEGSLFPSCGEKEEEEEEDERDCERGRSDEGTTGSLTSHQKARSRRNKSAYACRASGSILAKTEAGQCTAAADVIGRGCYGNRGNGC